MTNRTIAIILVLMVPNWVVGCSGGLSQLPAAPTSVTSSTIPSAAPATAAQERWNLTRTFTGHTGSEGCTIALDEIGRMASDSVLMIQRSAESIRFFTADHNTYVGTVAANEFFATEIEAGSTLQCGEARLRFRIEGRLSGRLSADGRSLVGQEISIFLFESGKMITRRWDWQARRE